MYGLLQKLAKQFKSSIPFFLLFFILIPFPAWSATPPTFSATGTVASANGSITPSWPTHQIGDIALLIVETDNQAVTLSSNASNFVEVSSSPQGVAGTRLTVFWTRATSASMTNPTVADSGNHQIAQIITFRGVLATGNPWDVITGNTTSTSSTSFTIPGATTTADNTLVVTIVSNGNDTTTAQASGWTNSNLTSLTERTNVNTTSGNGGGFSVATGIKTTAGNYGNTTGTLLNSSTQARMSLALKPIFPTFSIADSSLAEGNSGYSNMNFTVTLSNTANATVNYTTSNGTATVGSDYNATSGTLTFTSGGATTQTIAVPIAGDTIYELDETFTVTLSSPSGATIANATATGTILNDDLAYDHTNANPRLFGLSHKENINGDMKIIGNSMMRDATTHNCAQPTTNNNDITVEYVDVDADTSTFNSTTADLNLPAGTTANDILWAGIYWQGYYDGGATNTTKNLARSILFKNSTATTYSSIQADNTKFNWVYFDDAKSRWYYQGTQDVTSLVKAGLSGTYTVANIYSQTGKLNGGGFGAWALVVVYADPLVTLKNISVFDGYLAISSSDTGRTGVYASTTIPLTGFLTPTSGAINSKFLNFSGEGDVNTNGDYASLSNKAGTDIKLKNSLNPDNNPFNSTVSDNGVAVTTRNPSCPNTIGIDIDTFDIGSTALTPATQGQIIQNTQSSTNVKLASSGDGYFPGVFAFSTELYTPDVCYFEDLKFNGSPISASNLPQTGDKVDYNVSVTNKNNEPAKGVLIEKKFNKPNEIKYVTNSMTLAPIPGTAFSSKTDNVDSDTAQYENNTSKFFLGTGASGGTGGTINKDEITRFTYKAEVGDQNASENIYYVSYRNDVLNIDFTGLPIRKCSDFNNSFGVYTPIIGKFNTVRNNAVNVNGGDTDPIDPKDTKNALYTQIVNRPFTVDIISFDADNITPKAPTQITDLNLSIVELSADGNCTNTTLSAIQTLTFNTTDKYKPNIQVTPTRASKNAAFHMVTSTADLCSRDLFSIRPFTYNIEVNETRLIGNKLYRFDFNATQSPINSINPSLNYNATISNVSVDMNGTTQLIRPATCNVAQIPLVNTEAQLFNNPGAYNLSFTDGQSTITLAYPNVGDVNFTVTDFNWTKKADQSISNGKAFDDCVINSVSNVTDANGKIGCGVQGARVFNFFPRAFRNTVAIENFNNSTFTYISNNDNNDSNMSANILFGTTAVLEDNTPNTLNDNPTATNYTQGCFARSVEYVISLLNNGTTTWQNTWLNGGITAQQRIWFGDDRDTTVLPTTFISSFLNNNGVGWADFNSSEGNFTNGTANILMHFNITRDISRPDEPFKVAKNDFNITILDENGTTGVDFNRTLDQNTTFYYGRVYSPDKTISGNFGNDERIYYEVYCRTCNRIAMNMIGEESINSLNWFNNPLHTIVHTQLVDANYTALSGTISNGAQALSIDLTAPKVPHKDKIQMHAPSWLLQNLFSATATTNDFLVEFTTGATNWAGQGTLGRTIDDTNTSVAKKSNKRIEW